MMMRLHCLLLILLTAAGLASCSSHEWSPPRQSRVESQTHTQLLSYQDYTASLPPQEMAQLQHFLSRFDPEAVEHIRVEHHASGGLLRQRNEAMHAWLTEAGFTPSQIELTTTSQLDWQQAAVHVDSLHVIPPPSCPDWSMNSAHNFGNVMHSNFGCATAKNVGLMAAYPADLVRGYGNAGPDTKRNLLVVDKYRKDTLIPTKGGATSSASGGGQGEQKQSGDSGSGSGSSGK